MRAIRIHENGGPEVLRYEELPTPVPGPGQARVRVHAAGVNYIDVYQRTGQYAGPLPRTLGLEGAGVVTAGDLPIGTRVAWADVPGSYAEEVIAPVDRLVHVPDGVDYTTAASGMLQGMTAEYLTHAARPLAKDETVLVYAAAGGTGRLVVQFAKMRRTRVLAVVGTEAKAAIAREAGADEVIAYDDVVADVRRLTEDRGVDVVYDGVGRATWKKSLDALALRGTWVLFGAASGPVPPVDPMLLAKGSFHMTRPSLFHYVARREELEKRATAVLAALGAGSLRVRVDRELPLAEAAEAHRLLESRGTAGKLILVP